MFSQETFDFLYNLERNNSRDWFTEHKQEYETRVRQPALEFITAMAEPLAQLAPTFCALPKKVGGSLMRVHRDIRFSRDKSPYKTNVGIQFRHSLGKDVHAPGFYLHIAPIPEQCFVGVGCWHPAPDALRSIREAIAEHPQTWLAVKHDKGFADTYTLSGDSLARMPRGFDQHHPAAVDLRRKDYIGLAELDRETITSPNFVAHATRAFTKGAPLVRFLCTALDVPF